MFEYPMQCLLRHKIKKNSKEAYKMTTFGRVSFLAYRRSFLLFMTPDESDWMDEALFGRSSMNDCCLVDKLMAMADLF